MLEKIQEEIHGDFVGKVMRAWLDKKIIDDESRHPISGGTWDVHNRTHQEILSGVPLTAKHFLFARQAIFQLDGYPHGQFDYLKSEYGIGREQLEETWKRWKDKGFNRHILALRS